MFRLASEWYTYSDSKGLDPYAQPVRTPKVTEVPQISRFFLLNTAFENCRFEPIFTLKNFRSNPNSVVVFIAAQSADMSSFLDVMGYN